MNKLLLLLLFTTILLCSLNAQILIGYDEDQIIDYMEENYPGYTLNTGFGATPTTVKFVDTKKDRTFIFFLNDQMKCRYSKLMLDIGEYEKTINVLNEKYPKSGDYEWAIKKDGVDYTMSIEKTDWMFSIVTQKKD
jgi:hypothetical protein